MKYIVLTLVLGFGCVSVCFSNTNLDSLYKQAYYTDSVDAVIDLVPQFKKLCAADDLEYLCKLYFLIGYRARDEGQPVLAFSYYYESYEIAKELGDYSLQRASMLNIAILYNSIDDFVNAKKYKLRAIEYAKKAGQESKIASYLCNIGRYSRREGEIDSAVYYLEQAYDMEVDLGNLEGQAIVLNELGLCAYVIEDYDQAVDYYYMALNLNDTSNRIKYMVYTNHGLIALKRGDLSKSKTLLNQSIAAKKTLGKEDWEFIPQYNLLGEIYMKSGQYDSALTILTKALFFNDYNGLKGANTEEFYQTMRFLDEIQSIKGDKYLLVDLGVYEKYSEFLQWQTLNQVKLEKLNNRASLQMVSQRIQNEKHIAAIKKEVAWLALFFLILLIGGGQFTLFLRKRKKVLLLEKMDLFEEDFEKRYNSQSNETLGTN